MAKRPVQSSPTSAAPPPSPPLVDSGARVQVFADLLNPDIDPHDYAEQLPTQLGELRQLMLQEYAELADHTWCVGRKAECLRVYVEYMASAQVNAGMLANLEDAYDTYAGIAARLRSATAQAMRVTELIGSARQAAEAAYGDNEIPRFDRAG